MIKEGHNSFLYTDPNHDKKFVLKYYPESSIQDEIYVINEFKKLVQLSSEPEVCDAFGLVSIDVNGELYTGYLLEYIDGETLVDFKEAARINVESYLHLIEQLASGIMKSHRFGVIHGDLSLSNLIIDRNGNLRIIDFLFDVVEKPDFQSDIKKFKLIEEELFKALGVDDQGFVKTVHDICQSDRNIEAISKSIPIVEEYLYQFSLLDEKSKAILAFIVCNIPDDYQFGRVMKVALPRIPDFLRLPKTERDLEFEKKNKQGLKLKYLPEYVERQKHELDLYLTRIFYQLEQMNFVSFVLFFKELELKVITDYEIHIQVNLNINILKLKRLNDEFGFIESHDQDLLKILFDE